MIRTFAGMVGFALLTTCLYTVARAQEAATTTDAGTLTEQEADKLFKTRPYSPYAGRSFPIRPLFGDTHLHTSFSMDAGAFGARLGPRDAYKFARGEEVVSSTGQPVKLSRPLDFLVVTDHSDNMGFFPDLLAGKPELLADPLGRKWYDMIQNGQGAAAAVDIIVSFGAGKFKGPILYSPNSTAYRGAWHRTIDAAEEANEPAASRPSSGMSGRRTPAATIFTATSCSATVPIRRARSCRSRCCRPAATTRATSGSGCRLTRTRPAASVLAIAHNGNLSNGIDVPDRSSPSPARRSTASTPSSAPVGRCSTRSPRSRATAKPIPLLSPNDEFANFERWDKGNLDLTVAKKPEMLEFEYARSALKNGLKLEAKLGVNPYKFGLVGSTDAHTGLADGRRRQFLRQGRRAREPSPDRATHPFVSNPKTGLTIMGWEQTASGYAAVWAAENTRASIFDAMKRRETYATTGPRMVVRFFGGFDFSDADANTRSPAIAGYTKGVPMGGDLGPAPEGKAPTFLVAALKDPDRRQSRPLPDRQGLARRRPARCTRRSTTSPGRATASPARRQAAGVGNTVDVPNATWTNTIGAPELIAVWTIPISIPTQRAFYYGRVIEIPTPRWTAYDAKYFGLTLPPEVPMTTQERAYTSPIWYNPAG